MPASLIFAVLLVLVATVLVQSVLVWITAKVISAPNSEFKDAFKLSVAGVLLTVICTGAYLGIVKYYAPHAIPSGGWFLIIAGFCVQIIVSFWLTMSILGIGFVRAILVALLTNALGKILAGVVHAYFHM